MKGKKVFWYFLKASIFLNWQLTPCILNKIQWNIYLIYCWWQVISSGYMSYHVLLKCWPGQSWLRIWCRHDGFSFSYLRHQEDNIEKKMELQSLQWVSKLESDNVLKEWPQILFYLLETNRIKKFLVQKRFKQKDFCDILLFVITWFFFNVDS